MAALLCCFCRICPFCDQSGCGGQRRAPVSNGGHHYQSSTTRQNGAPEVEGSGGDGSSGTPCESASRSCATTSRKRR